MAGKSRWLLAVAAVLNFACSMANASPPIKVWWAEPYGTAYANGQGPMYSTPQQACAHFDGSWPGYTYRYVDPPEPGHLWYWCEPLVNGQPMAPGYARDVKGNYIGQKELCIDPIRRTYNANFNRNPSVPLEEQCPDLPRQTANTCPVGNPISPLTGQKVQFDPPDFQSTGAHPLVFQRTYRSDTAQHGSMVGGVAPVPQDTQTPLG